MSAEEERNGNQMYSYPFYFYFIAGITMTLSSRAAEVFGPQCMVTLRNPKADRNEPVKQFTFDAVFGPNDTQKHIYDICASGMVESVLGGYNGTFFAYGQV